jgi:hypothetical protein
VTTTGRDDRPCPEAGACISCRCDANIFGTAAVRHVGSQSTARARAVGTGPARPMPPSRYPAGQPATRGGAQGTGAGALPAWVQRRVDAAVSEINERLITEFDLLHGAQFSYEGPGAEQDGPAV